MDVRGQASAWCIACHRLTFERRVFRFPRFSFWVVSGEFSKKADHGKWFGAKAKNHQQKEYHDPPKAER